MIDPKHLTRDQAQTLTENVCVDLSVDEIRNYFDNFSDLPERLETELDNAQGHVFAGAPVAYVLIRVTS